MTKKDYEIFLNKIKDLNNLITLLNDSPEKYQLFIKCKTHQDVVNLAKKWGFDIGRRWGEP